VARIVARRTGPGAGTPRIPRRGRIFDRLRGGDVNMANVPDAGMGNGGLAP
jgi:hypothetical protein